ncbi:hypothetical protein ACXZ1K_17125 [Pedobacter sp. PWIIR3]
MQTSALRTPDKIVIDGVDREWKNTFPAYNTRLRMYYAFSNNDSILYLTIKVHDRQAIRKILLGGVEVRISKFKAQNKQNPASVIFPIYTKNYPLWNSELMEFKDTLNNKHAVVSVFKARNRMVDSKMKLVRVKGLKSFTDSVLSVYNHSSIKVKSKFDAQLNYIFEVLVPLSEFVLDIEKDSAFYYELVLNGISANQSDVVVDENRRLLMVTGKNISNIVFPLNPEYLDLAFPTSFSGKCTLNRH